MHHLPFDTGVRHHLYWPSKKYKTELEKAFRDCPCVVVPLGPLVHALQHACLDDTPPVKPAPQYMVAVLEAYQSGRCGCAHHMPHNVYRIDQQRRDNAVA